MGSQGDGQGQLADHVPASQPDKALPCSDLFTFGKQGLKGFLPLEVEPPGAVKALEEVSKGSEKAEEEGFDVLEVSEKLEEAALALNETEELLRQLEAQSAGEAKACRSG